MADQNKSSDHNSEPEDVKRAKEEYLDHIYEENLLKRFTNLNLRSESDQKWLLFIYILTEPVDGVYGAIYPISMHGTYSEAISKREQLVIKHKLASLKIYKACDWRKLAVHDKGDAIDYVRNYEDKNYQRKLAMHKAEEKRKRLEEGEQIKQYSKGSLEEYARLWFEYLQEAEEMEALEDKLQKATKRAEQTLKKLRTAHKANQQHEASCMNYLKRYLYERNCKPLYERLHHGYLEKKNLVFSPNNGQSKSNGNLGQNGKSKVEN